MRPVALLAAAVVSLAGCTSLDRGQAPLVERRPGTEVTDAELQARGEWTAEDAEARRLLGPGRRPVRLASQARALCDVLRVGRHELVVPSPSAALTRLLGLAYEPRRFHARRAGAWVLLRRDAPPVIVGEDVEGRPATGEDASPRVFVELGRRLARQVEGLERVAGDVRP